MFAGLLRLSAHPFKLRARRSFYSAAYFFIPSWLEATSVVALIDHSKDSLVIAADCRVNRTHGASEKCKIIEEPDCVVAIAGRYEVTDAGFHLRQLFHAACQQPGDLRGKAEAFPRISQRPYQRAVRRLREG
jgi:hypothetical protein